MANATLLYIVIIVATSLLAFCAEKQQQVLNCNVRKLIYYHNNAAFKQKKILIKILLLMMVFVPWFFLAFRGNGADLGNYVISFEESLSIKNVFTQGFDVGYFLLNFFVRCLSPDYLLFSTIVSFVTLFLAFNTFWKLKEKLPFGITVSCYMAICYLQSFNLIRLYLALSIIIFSTRYLFYHNFLKYLIGVFCAFLFHNSAIICVVFIIPFLPKLTSGILMFLCSLGLLIVWVFPQIISLVLPFDRYQHYMESILPLVVGYVTPVQCLAFIVPIIAFVKRKKATDSFLRYILFGILLFFFLSVIGFRIGVFGRLTVYLYPIFGFGFAYLWRYNNLNKETRIVLGVFIICYIAVMLYLYFYSYLKIDGISKYCFFWER